MVEICPVPILCEAKNFSATYWAYRLDVIVALHFATKNLQRPLNFYQLLLTSATNFCH
jgi:hypothetical protein